MADIPEGYGLATMHWAQTGGVPDMTVTCGYVQSLDGDVTPTDAADAIYSYWVAGDCPCDPALLSTAWAFTGVTVLEQRPTGLFSGAHFESVTGASPPLTDPTPAYTPLVVTKYTDLSGVQFRGRMYPPSTFADSGQIDALGGINSTFLASIRSAYTALYDLWVGGDFQPFLLHNAPAVGLTPDPTGISQFLVQPSVAIQRRRKNRA